MERVVQKYIETGFNDLDKIIGGFQYTDLINITGDPGIGTTSFALSILQNIAIEKGKPAAFFSLDMSRSTIINRIISSQTEIPYERFAKDILRDYEQEQYVHKTQNLKNAPIHLDASSRHSIESLTIACKRLKEKENVEVFFIDNLDYLTLYSQEEAKINKWMSKKEEVTRIAIELKKLAKDLNISFIVLSHLDRNTEFRKKTDAKPTLNDTGVMAVHADLVIILYRPDYYGVIPDMVYNLTDEAIVVKNRNGKSDAALIRFKKDFFKFTDAITYDEPFPGSWPPFNSLPSMDMPPGSFSLGNKKDPKKKGAKKNTDSPDDIPF